VPLKLIKSFVLLQKYCKPPNDEISRNFQGNNVRIQSKEFREILMTKMRNFDFENGSTKSAWHRDYIK
jgi:hypothetical protein